MNQQQYTPVLEFHLAFNHPVASYPTVPPMALRKLRARLIGEEFIEFVKASGLEVIIDSQTDTLTLIETDRPCDMVECADGLGDLRYVIDGANLVYGFPGHAVLMEIHRSNMSKLGEDGKPIYRDDMKVLKGPNYSPPDIEGLLRRYGYVKG